MNIPFHAPIEPGPEQRVTHLTTLANHLMDVIDVAGDEAGLVCERASGKYGSAPELPPLCAYFKLRDPRTGEVFTVMVTRGWGG